MYLIYILCPSHQVWRTHKESHPVVVFPPNDGCERHELLSNLHLVDIGSTTLTLRPPRNRFD